MIIHLLRRVVGSINARRNISSSRLTTAFRRRQHPVSARSDNSSGELVSDGIDNRELVTRHGDATAGSQATLNLTTVNSIVESSVNTGGAVVNAGAGNANILTVDPGLDPAGLKDHGSLTKTIALSGGSPAIDSGNAMITTGTDERGIIRDAIPDLGAFEFVGGLLAAGADSGHAAQIKSTPTGHPAVQPAALRRHVWAASA